MVESTERMRSESIKRTGLFSVPGALMMMSWKRRFVAGVFIRATTSATLGLSGSYYLLVERNLLAGQPYIEVLTYPRFVAAASLAPFLIVGCGVVTASAAMLARGASRRIKLIPPGRLRHNSDSKVWARKGPSYEGYTYASFRADLKISMSRYVNPISSSAAFSWLQFHVAMIPGNCLNCFLVSSLAYYPFYHLNRTSLQN